MKRIVVFSGAGVSAESGLQTFRDSDGLWENYDIMDVATPEAWEKNPKMVLEFYNKRRVQSLNAKPNNAHYSIAGLQKNFDVHVITQNIDDLHERAGSKKVLHLHGEITKSKSSVNEQLIYPITSDTLAWGDKCKEGSQLRPHVVWFGEAVPEMDNAIDIVKTADILIVVGTSLNVYPAANLVRYCRKTCISYLIDPKQINASDINNLTIVKEKATIGVPIVASKLLESLTNV